MYDMTQDFWLDVIRLLQGWGFVVESVDEATGRLVVRVPDEGSGGL